MKPDWVKRADSETHYRGVSQTSSPADPLGPIVHRYLHSGDEDAMDRVVECTRPKLLGVARRIGAPQDAEDAVQGAYMALVRKRGHGLDAPVMPWLLTTVIRLAYRRKAKHGRQRDLARRLAHPREPGAPESAALDAERELLVRSAVARLPSRYRDPVVLRHLEGLSTKDTALLLDVPEATIRTRLHRAAKLLRAKVPAVLLASALFLPWCVADAARRLVPLTRPIAAHPVLASGLGAALVAGVALLLVGLPDTGRGSVAPRPAPVRVVEPTPRVSRGSPQGAPPPAAGAAERGAAEEEGKGSTGPKPPPEVAPVPVLPSGVPAEAWPSAQPPTHPAVSAPREEAANPFAEINQVVKEGRTRQPQPPGMAFIEGGYVLLGSTPETLDGLLAGRPPEHRRDFLYESPRHRRLLRPYWIGRYEVTNAQYLRFLSDHALTYTTGARGETLEELAARFVGQQDEERRAARQVVWRQLYEANKGRIWRAFDKAGRDILTFRKDHTIDETATAEALRREPLPRGLTLEFYRLRPPAHWPGTRPAAALADHPVRYVSYNDAERLAEWAGMHLPTEAEWEWAARGPDGRRFPWGDRWYQGKTHANWGGLETDAQHEPTTMGVQSLDTGRSWCGVHHMTGNVAEWTSSWFRAYPDSTHVHRYMGRWIKVIRGGGAGDGELLTLRGACRNFIGGGPKAPPFPENRFRWVGLRLAAYLQPGRDHVPPVLRRAVRGRHLKPAALEAERFAAFVARDWTAPEELAPDHVYVRGRSTAVVFVPVTSFVRDEVGPDMRAAYERPPRTTAKLIGLSRGEHPRWILGALHTDLGLDGVEVPRPAPEQPKKKRRGRAKPPAVERGACLPGTYLVVLWHGRVALTTPALEFVCFLPEREATSPSVEVSPWSSKKLGPPTLHPSLEADEGGLDLALPLGGARGGDKHLVRIRAGLPYVRDDFHARSVRGFLRSTDGR